MEHTVISPHTLRVLEFSVIREMLADRTTSEPGRELACLLTPGVDPVIINERLATVSEMRAIMEANHTIPIRGIKDIRPALERSRIEGAALDAETLLDVASTLQASRLLHTFGKHLHRTLLSPRIEALVAGMGIFQHIEDEVNRAIDPGGIVKDQASSTLSRIRREQGVTRDRTREHLNTLIQSDTGRQALQDQVVTMRDGRYVVPVRSDHRGQVRGVMHDQSASGATVFIEPLAVVEMNNRLRELEAEERREIDRILSAITTLVREDIETVAVSMDLLQQFDFYYAAAQLSLDLRASRPRMNKAGRIKLRNARHPLLALPQTPEDAPTVTPLTIEVGADTSTLVITGPNMGGKTVALKTVGLLTLMAQSGLHVPADEPSDLSVFTDIIADIGDEQSIQANLSTFSSHLRHVVTILEEADDRTLVLLDELGAGTDPTAGAALGMAVLESLTARRSVTVATTHYGALKEFAARTDHVENGSMEFDVNTLAPTYRFRQGIPGGSYAVEIGRRLGLTQTILDRTTEIIGKDERRLDEIIITLDRERQMHEETREEIENQRDELNRLTAEYREKLDTFRKTERDLLRSAREEADRVIREANTMVERTVADLRAEQASRASIKRAKDTIAAQRTQLQKLAEEKPVSKPIESIAPGDEVWVESLQKKAVVVQASDSGDRLRVRAGRIELTVRRSDLRAPAESDKTAEAKQKPAEPRNVQVRTETRITPELDVRGYTADDALEAVDKYVDQASIDGLARVRILHGKGTGVLRQEIRAFLKHHELVKSTRFAAQNEGGNGVTVVDMDS